MKNQTNIADKMNQLLYDSFRKPSFELKGFLSREVAQDEAVKLNGIVLMGKVIDTFLGKIQTYKVVYN